MVLYPFAAAQPTPRPQRSEKKHEGKGGGKKESSPVHICIIPVVALVLFSLGEANTYPSKS